MRSAEIEPESRRDYETGKRVRAVPEIETADQTCAALGVARARLGTDPHLKRVRRRSLHHEAANGAVTGATDHARVSMKPPRRAQSIACFDLRAGIEPVQMAVC